MEYVKFEKVSLKNHPQLNERWLQERIAEDPIILGLGDVVLRVSYSQRLLTGCLLGL